MRIIVVGCGRMGAGLALSLSRRGHEVSVMDRDPAALEALGPAFRGGRQVGLAFDRDTLERAGIARADALAAVTSSDDANVVTARLARLVFHVPRVVARLYDPRKAEVYRRLGLQTISTTEWGINRIAELIAYSQLDAVVSLGGDMDIIDVELPAALDGRTAQDLTVPGEVQVVAVSRGGKGFLPTSGAVLRAGDVLHIAVLAASVDRLKALLGP